MTKNKDVVNYFKTQYPFSKAEEWDKVGPTFGGLNNNTSGIVVALDLTPQVLELALQESVNLIITHHPFIFNDEIEKDFLESPYKEEMVKTIKENKITLLALHTNYDNSNEGTAFQVGKHMKLQYTVQPFGPEKSYGVQFQEKINIKNLSKHLYKYFGFGVSNANFDSNISFNNWVILPGSAPMEDVIRVHSQKDTVIFTSDISWMQWITAEEMGIKLGQISHAIEDVFTFDINEQLNDNFEDVTSFIFSKIPPIN